ncbi:uncharacterized protein LACBIDRAFT_326579 [Laccaria bicolor S238N-H82]|uniref:Predicted protein n=1 Tax=Laccaria bicolor (strain S238N-H82 / ATCC MYA-4686) TaxID=486041 RepID=B0D937_LACBS|nr:uncharacterized protein LACBIDRAFT_326579 [Laccaria bicolor S238N-H82]EDR09187.1 predicted protein [Laccaria bicolor S238N-H82]|eukprot:XP_001880500.1 predicted protein [Laccaria bicolor S238N-H82]
MPPQTVSSFQARIYGVEKLDGYTPYLFENIFSEKTIGNGAMSFSGASHPGQKEDQPMAVVCNPFELSTMSPRVLRPPQFRHHERTKSPNVFFAPSTKSGEQEKRVVPHYIYYRKYVKGGPTGSTYAIYNDDQSICRLEVKSITPPHTAGSLRQNLHKIESTPSTNSRLLISIWSQEFCDNSYRLDLSGDTYPGSSEHDPVVLSLDLVGGMNSKVLDEQMMQVSGAPPKVAFVHYRLFSEDGEFASKRSFDKEDPPLGRINVLTLRPPHTVNSLKMCIACQEGLTPVTDEMPNVQLFANLFSRDPMADGPILFYEGAYPGCEEGEPIALVYKKDERA